MRLSGVVSNARISLPQNSESAGKWVSSACNGISICKILPLCSLFSSLQQIERQEIHKRAMLDMVLIGFIDGVLS